MRMREIIQEDIKSTPIHNGVSYQIDGGHIDIASYPHSPRKESVVDFVVDEDKRGQGIGRKLLKHAISKHHDIGAQVSSISSLKLFYDFGFRNPNNPTGSFADYEKQRQEDSSIFMAMNDQEGNKFLIR